MIVIGRKVRWLIYQARWFYCATILATFILLLFLFKYVLFPGINIRRSHGKPHSSPMYLTPHPAAAKKDGRIPPTLKQHNSTTDEHLRRQSFLDADLIFLEECKKEQESQICKQLLKYRQMDWHSSKFRQNELIDFTKVLLIIHFTEPNYTPAAKLYAIYWKVFADVVFCGPDSDFWPKSNKVRRDYQAKLMALPEKVRYFNYGAPVKYYGENAYICLNLALENDPNANAYDGALVIADDVMLNYWNWKSASLDLRKNWLIKNGTMPNIFEIRWGQFCSGNSTDNESDCTPKDDEDEDEDEDKDEDESLVERWYVSFNEQVFNFASDAHRLDKDNTTKWPAIFARLSKAAGGNRRLFRSSADLFYVAKRYLSEIRPVLKLFDDHHVWQEIAVPSAFHAITEPNDLQFIELPKNTKIVDGGYGSQTDFMVNMYQPDMVFVHPFKMTEVFGEETPTEYRYQSDKKLLSSRSVINRDRYKQGDWTITCVYCYTLKMALGYQHAIGHQSALSVINQN